MPLIRRIPKRGFSNTQFQTRPSLVNVGDLEAVFESGAQIDPAMLRSKGIIRRKGPVKILGDGNLTRSLSVKADAFSKSAEKKIREAGGTFEKIDDLGLRTKLKSR